MLINGEIVGSSLDWNRVIILFKKYAAGKFWSIIKAQIVRLLLEFPVI